jgi:putative membrane protein
MRYRVLSRTTAFIKKKRVQDAESSQNPFQRRKNIHHLKVIAASGAGGLGLEISDLATEDIHEILKWLVGDRSEEKQGEPQSITE